MKKYVLKRQGRLCDKKFGNLWPRWLLQPWIRINVYNKYLKQLYVYFQYNRLINDMLAVYNTAEICAYNEPFKCGLHLQPELQFIMSHSRDWDELQHVWTEWRRNTGRRIRDLYEQLVDLTNQAARLNSKFRKNSKT